MIRKIVHNNLNITATKSYVPYQDLESKALLVELLDMPELFIDHLRRYTHSLTTQMVFGFRTPSIDDPKLKQLFWVSCTYNSATVTDATTGNRKVLSGTW